MIKKILTILLSVFLVISVGYLIVKKKQASGSPESSKEARKAKKVDSQTEYVISVYYFYSEPRCHTCKTIEKYSKLVVNKGFKDELQNDKIEWKLIDMKKAENKHYVEDYDLYTKSLVISVRERDTGKEVEWKNLKRVWKLVDDKEKFTTYVTEKINKFLTKYGVS